MSNPVRFNQQDLQGNMSIEDSEGLHLKFSGTGAAAILTDERHEGKLYYEVTILNRGSNAHYIGAFYEGNYFGTSIYANGFGLYTHYEISIFRKNSRTTVENTTAIPAGTVFGVAIDYDNKHIDYYRNGVHYAEISYTYNNIRLVYGGGASSSGEALFNFGATPFQYSIPEGYYSYDGSRHNVFTNKILLLSENKAKTILGSAYYYNNNQYKDVTDLVRNPKGDAGYSGTKIENLFDGEVDTEFTTTKTSLTASWEMEEPSSLSAIGIRMSDELSSIVFYGSYDDSNWDTIYNQIGIGTVGSNDIQVFPFEKPSEKYKYFRFTVTSPGWTIVKDVFLYEAPLVIIDIPTQSEQDFINHGMSPQELSELDFSSEFTEKHYIQDNSAQLLNSKAFKQKLDTKKNIKSLNIRKS